VDLNEQGGYILTYAEFLINKYSSYTLENAYSDVTNLYNQFLTIKPEYTYSFTLELDFTNYSKLMSSFPSITPAFSPIWIVSDHSTNAPESGRVMYTASVHQLNGGG
jgi:hypothetical protein